MKLAIAGGTGFVGKALTQTLLQKGHELVILTRQSALQRQSSDKTRYVTWDPSRHELGGNTLENIDVIINLTGESIAAKRWSHKQKLKILESRCDSTQTIVQAIRKTQKKPKVLINASAVGYYGPRDDRITTEKDGAGKDFLAQVCKAWEAHAIRAEDFGVRVVRLRIGIVLEKGGGALQKMIPPFQFFMGGPLGSGKQWMSWVHRQDVIGLILFALENPEAKGAINATAPNPVTMNEFARTLGKVMHRPSFARVPGFMLKILLGEMSDVLLTGQKAVPEKSISLGYRFRYPTLQEALESCLTN